MSDQKLEKEKKALAKEYKELLKISYQSLNKSDKKLIRERGRKIFDLHEGVKRYEEIYLKICS